MILLGYVNRLLYIRYLNYRAPINVIYKFKASFHTKSRPLYNFVIHFFVVSCIILKRGKLTLKFVGRRRYKPSHSRETTPLVPKVVGSVSHRVAHSHFIKSIEHYYENSVCNYEFDHYYEYNCRHSDVNVDRTLHKHTVLVLRKISENRSDILQLTFIIFFRGKERSIKIMLKYS